MRTRTVLAAFIVAATLPFTLGACGSDSTSATPVTRTVTATAAATETATATAQPGDPQPDTTAPGTQTRGTDAGAPDGVMAPTPCGPRTLSAATVNAAIARIPTDGRTYKWAAEGSNFNSCNAISYVELTTEMGTGSSPWQLMIFNSAGEFLGTGVKCNLPGQKVTGAGPDHIDVRYSYSKPGETTAGGTGVASVSFRWNGSRVVMVGSLPTDLTYGKC